MCPVRCVPGARPAGIRRGRRMLGAEDRRSAGPLEQYRFIADCELLARMTTCVRGPSAQAFKERGRRPSTNEERFESNMYDAIE